MELEVNARIEGRTLGVDRVLLPQVSDLAMRAIKVVQTAHENKPVRLSVFRVEKWDTLLVDVTTRSLRRVSARVRIRRQKNEKGVSHRRKVWEKHAGRCKGQLFPS